MASATAFLTSSPYIPTATSTSNPSNHPSPSPPVPSSRISRICSTAASTLFFPFLWVARKVRGVAQGFFGAVLRAAVFQLGEYKKPFAYFILRCYQKCTSDPRDAKPIDLDRLQESRTLLESFGGSTISLPSIDAAATLDCLHFTSEGFFQKVRERGGAIKSIDFPLAEGGSEKREVVEAPKELHEVLKKKFSFETIQHEYREVILLPFSPNKEKLQQTTPLIFIRLSPGRGMAMCRWLIMNYLAAGCDVFILDPRGTLQSTGTPSEAGYYLDVETAYKHITEQLGYRPENIYAEGFCFGAAIMAYLKKKHPQTHFIAQNPFDSLPRLVKKQVCFGTSLSHFALPKLQAPRGSPTARLAEEDGFDMTRKFREIRLAERQRPGKCILIHTKTDRTVPPNSIQNIQRAMGNKAPLYRIECCPTDRKANGHITPPIEHEAVWRELIPLIGT